MDNKRGNQWLLDASEEGPVFNKKQAIESIKEVAGRAVMESSLWLDGSISQSGCLTGNHLVGLKPGHSSDFLNENIMHSTVPAPVDIEKNGFVNQAASDSSICLTMSRTMENPLCLNTGLEQQKVIDAGITDGYLAEFVGKSCHGANEKALSTTYHNQQTADNMIPLPTYNIAEGNTMSVNPAFSKMDKNIISAGQASGNRDGSFMLANQFYNGIENNVLSSGQAFNCRNYNVNNVSEQYEKENSSFTSIGGSTYSKGYENFVSVDPYFERVNESVMATGSAYNEGQRNVVFRNHQDASAVTLGGTLFHKENSSLLSIVENLGEGDQNTISFGGFQDKSKDRDDYTRLISAYGTLLSQPSQSPGALGLQDAAEQLSANVTSIVTSRSDSIQKNKEPKPKKGTSSNFPSNVKSLLTTGIFDGVPVKYVSWSREKNLRGVVKGTGYLCSCQDCKLSRVINAYEFERHAGCKTKHPNNHIYFENGKTIYAAVQELKNTPQDMLFEAIQNVTGSPVNQKNFSAWKASYKAATQELQRIYGKDDMVVTS